MGRRLRETRVWFHWRVLKLRELVEAGLSAEEIAPQIGVTASAVRNEAYLRGYSFKRRPSKPRPRRVPPKPPNLLALVEAEIAADPALGPHLPSRPGQSHRRAWPRHLAAYVAHVELSFPLKHIGPVLGCRGQTLGYGVRQVEERRDEDPHLDAWLDRIAERAREVAA